MRRRSWPPAALQQQQPLLVKGTSWHSQLPMMPPGRPCGTCLKCRHRALGKQPRAPVRCVGSIAQPACMAYPDCRGISGAAGCLRQRCRSMSPSVWPGRHGASLCRCPRCHLDACAAGGGVRDRHRRPGHTPGPGWKHCDHDEQVGWASCSAQPVYACGDSGGGG